MNQRDPSSMAGTVDPSGVSGTSSACAANATAEPGNPLAFIPCAKPEPGEAETYPDRSTRRPGAVATSPGSHQ